MAAKCHTRAAASVLYVVLPLLCCGCHHKSLRSEIAQSAPVPRTTTFETRGRKPRDIQLASGATESLDPHTEVTENLRRAQSELDAGRASQAAHFYERVLRDEPDHVQAHHRLAIIADLTQDFLASERHYRAALRAHPADATILNDLGYSYLLQRRFEESEQVLREAVSTAGPTERTTANLALLYASLGDNSRAVEVLMMAAPDRATAENRLGRLVAYLDQDAVPGRFESSRAPYDPYIPTDLSPPADDATDQIVMANAASLPRRAELPEIRPANIGEVVAKIAAAPQPLPLWTPRPTTVVAEGAELCEPARSAHITESFASAKNPPQTLPPAYFEMRSQTADASSSMDRTGDVRRDDVILMIGHSKSFH